MQSLLRAIKSRFESARKTWHNIELSVRIAIVALAVALTALLPSLRSCWYDKQQVDIGERGLEHEQSLQPRLEYSYEVVLSETELQVISDTAKQLAETFYEKLYEYTQANVDATYLESVEAVLPLSTTIPARPSEVKVVIQNNAESRLATATKVRVFLEMLGAITFYNVDSREPYSVIQGGKGEHQIIIEVDRIVAGESVTVVVASETMGLETRLDQVVIEARRATVTGMMMEFLPLWEALGVKAVLPWPEYPEYAHTALEGFNFPRIGYIPAEQPSYARVQVTSDQGKATPIQGESTIERDF